MALRRKIEVDQDKLVSNIQQVVKTLNSLRSTIESGREKLKDMVDKVDDKTGYINMLETMKRMRDEINKWIEKVEVVSASEIFIGVVGRYSHGKSSLLNAILVGYGEGKKGEILPTGEGIVTAIPTIIRFRREISEPRFRKGIDGEILTLEDYKSWVRNPGDTSVVNALHIEMPVGDDPFKKELCDKSVVLVDTPGLGGPYWRDISTLKEWMKRFSMVLLVVKATDITKSAAKDVLLFLRDFSKPILPVITFWDVWPNSQLYEDCRDADEAFNRSIELLIENFPMFDEDELRFQLSAVSPVIYLQGDEAQKVDWLNPLGNMDNLKKALLDYVRDKRDELTGEKKVSFLQMAKISEMAKAIEGLFDTYDYLRKEITKISKESTKSFSEYEEIESVLESFFERAEEQISEISSRIYEGILDRLEELRGNDYSNLDYFNSDVENLYVRNLKRLENRLSSLFESRVVVKVESILENKLDIDEKKRDNYIKLLRRASRYFKFDDISPEPLSLGTALSTTGGIIGVIKKLLGKEREDFRKKAEAKVKKWKEKHSESAIKEAIASKWEEIKMELRESAFEPLMERIEKMKESRERILERYSDFISELDDRMEDIKDLVEL